MKLVDLKSAITATARLDLGHFADRLGLAPESPRAQKMFADFQELARLMRRFDSKALARIISADIAPIIARRREARRLMNRAHFDESRQRAILAYRDGAIFGSREEMDKAIETAPDDETRLFLVRLGSLNTDSAIDVLNDALIIAFWSTDERIDGWERWHERLRNGPRRHTRERRKRLRSNQSFDSTTRLDARAVLTSTSQTLTRKATA